MALATLGNILQKIAADKQNTAMTKAIKDVRGMRQRDDTPVMQPVAFGMTRPEVSGLLAGVGGALAGNNPVTQGLAGLAGASAQGGLEDLYRQRLEQGQTETPRFLSPERAQSARQSNLASQAFKLDQTKTLFDMLTKARDVAESEEQRQFLRDQALKEFSLKQRAFEREGEMLPMQQENLQARTGLAQAQAERYRTMPFGSTSRGRTVDTKAIEQSLLLTNWANKYPNLVESMTFLDPLVAARQTMSDEDFEAFAAQRTNAFAQGGYNVGAFPAQVPAPAPAPSTSGQQQTSQATSSSTGIPSINITKTPPGSSGQRQPPPTAVKESQLSIPPGADREEMLSVLEQAGYVIRRGE